jgi:hypothetical protein
MARVAIPLFKVAIKNQPYSVSWTGVLMRCVFCGGDTVHYGHAPTANGSSDHFQCEDCGRLSWRDMPTAKVIVFPGVAQLFRRRALTAETEV